MKNSDKFLSRRKFLELSGTAAFAAAMLAPDAHSATLSDTLTAREAALAGAVERLLGAHANQIQLRLSPLADSEEFHISGTPGHILIHATSPSAAMMGVNWYLKYVAGVSISWNGDCLDQLPATLPAPTASITQRAVVRHRFALNDTNDGYTGPYWTWSQWEHLIDVLALHGINEVLVYMGAEAVYQQTFRAFGFSTEELRNWLPTPAHQPWWLLQNLSGWVGPSVSQHLIDSRLALAAKITNRLRDLGMTPVLPGYFGMVPDKFAVKHPGAPVVPQGTWQGLKRPDWLDPNCAVFADVAGEYYRAQQKLLGPATMFKMDPLHEGGRAGNINIGKAAASIEAQLQLAHPGACWAILGWLQNPQPELLAGIKDKSHVLILDGQSDRFDYKDRDVEWNHTPYAFGVIWNFGGHTTIGANISVWNDRYFHQLGKPGTSLNGIAVMPEASCNNPAAFACLTEMAWRQHQLDLPSWFAQWAAYRYGAQDENAAQAWEILRSTAYVEKSGKWSESHDNLFSAQPGLSIKSACSWSPQHPRYDLAAFKPAVEYLLKVPPSLRISSAYRYDLVDLARQTLANQSRVLLPKINAAYIAKDAQAFRQLSRQWLDRISALNRIVACDQAFLFGAWIASARAAGSNSVEQNQFEFDARSLLLEWGPEASRNSGVHDYANREWNGLLEFYHQRWSIYFSALEDSLKNNEPVKEIDWFAIDQNFARETNAYPNLPAEDYYQTIWNLRHELQE